MKDGDRVVVGKLVLVYEEDCGTFYPLVEMDGPSPEHSDEFRSTLAFLVEDLKRFELIPRGGEKA